MKGLRTVLTVVLLLFVGATVGTLIAQESGTSDLQPVAGGIESPSDPSTHAETEPVIGDGDVELMDAPAETAPDGALGDVSTEPTLIEQVYEAPEEAVSNDPACVVEAVYFHSTHRCVTCLKIERDARAIVEDVFAAQLAAGMLSWSTVNMEEDPSTITQFNLAAPSLVLIRKVGDEMVDWVTLEETWALVRSSTRYSDYIISSFAAFLGECP